MDEAILPDERIDLKGYKCPYTYVKSKLAIEALTVGHVLEIIVDYDEASDSILKSMQDHKHRVLSVEKINDTDWVLLIRKELME